MGAIRLIVHTQIDGHKQSVVRASSCRLGLRLSFVLCFDGPLSALNWFIDVQVREVGHLQERVNARAAVLSLPQIKIKHFRACWALAGPEQG